MVAFGSRAASLAAAVLVVSSAALARADPISETECVQAHRQAQIDRKSRALSSAVQKLRRCADSACPKLIASDCAEWLVETERALPSVVVVATGPDGGDAQAVRVLVDGNPLVDRVTGAAIDVDPGQHRFRFELEGRSAIERTVTIREGEQRRRIEVAFGDTRGAAISGTEPASTPAPPDREHAGVGPWPYALGAVGIIGLGGFAYFGYRGLRTKADLDELNCKPACPQDRVDEGNRQFLIADISLGVGVVALGVATYLWLHRPPEQSALRIQAGPDRAFVGWHARF